MRQHLPKDYERRRDRAVFVSPRAKASNPGAFQVEWLQFFKAFPFPALWVALIVVIWLLATLKFNWLCGLPLLGILFCSFVAIQRVRDHFAFGNTLPGLIVSQQPPLIAVLTNLSTGRGKCNTIKVLEQPFPACGLASSPIGTRVPTVATYIGTGQSGHWDDFYPVLLTAVTRDEKVIHRALASFSETDWLELESTLSTLPSPPPPGLHRIGWTLSAVDFAQTSFARREKIHSMKDLTTDATFRVYSRGEGTPRILYIHWPNAEIQEQQPDSERVEAINAMAGHRLRHDAVILDFSRWTNTPREWISWWKNQTGRQDIPLALVLPRDVIVDLDIANVHSTRDAALDWMEAKLAT